MVTEKYLKSVTSEYWHPEPKAFREALTLLSCVKSSDINAVALKQVVVEGERTFIVEYWDGEIYFRRVVPLLHCTVVSDTSIFILLKTLLSVMVMARDVIIQITEKSASVILSSDTVVARFPTSRMPYYHPLTPPSSPAEKEFSFAAATIKAAVLFASYASSHSNNLIYWHEDVLQGNFNFNSFKIKVSPTDRTVGFSPKMLLVIAAMLSQSKSAKHIVDTHRLWIEFDWGWLSISVSTNRIPRWRSLLEGKELIGTATVYREELVQSIKLIKLYPYEEGWSVTAKGSKVQIAYKDTAAYTIGEGDFELAPNLLWVAAPHLRTLLQVLPVQESYKVEFSLSGMAFTSDHGYYTVCATRGPTRVAGTKEAPHAARSV
jgi:hypothetical protein